MRLIHSVRVIGGVLHGSWFALHRLYGNRLVQPIAYYHHLFGADNYRLHGSGHRLWLGFEGRTLPTHSIPKWVRNGFRDTKKFW